MSVATWRCPKCAHEIQTHDRAKEVTHWCRIGRRTRRYERVEDD